jgi:hypothetical protein
VVLPPSGLTMSAVPDRRVRHVLTFSGTVAAVSERRPTAGPTRTRVWGRARVCLDVCRPLRSVRDGEEGTANGEWRSYAADVWGTPYSPLGQYLATPLYQAAATGFEITRGCAISTPAARRRDPGAHRAGLATLRHLTPHDVRRVTAV